MTPILKSITKKKNNYLIDVVIIITRKSDSRYWNSRLHADEERLDILSEETFLKILFKANSDAFVLELPEKLKDMLLRYWLQKIQKEKGS